VIIHERDLDRIKTAIVDQFLRANSVRVEAQAEHVAR
jgi:hypothetical protein